MALGVGVEHALHKGTVLEHVVLEESTERIIGDGAVGFKDSGLEGEVDLGGAQLWCIKEAEDTAHM